MESSDPAAGTLSDCLANDSDTFGPFTPFVVSLPRLWPYHQHIPL